MKNGQRSEFDSTRMTLIRGVATDAASNGEALATFVDRYGDPLKAYLQRSMRLSQAEAEEAVQDFFVQKLVVNDNANLADVFLKQPPNRSFRTYLLRSLRNFVVDRFRSSKKHAYVQIDDREFFESDPHDAFEAEWAQNLFEMTLKRMKTECEAKGQKTWKVFELRFLEPARTGQRPPALKEIAKVVGLENATKVQSQIEVGKRKFQRHFRAVVAAYLPLESNRQTDLLEAELGELLQSMKKLPPLLEPTIGDHQTASFLDLLSEPDSEAPLPSSEEIDLETQWELISTTTIEDFVDAIEPRLSNSFRGVSVWGGEILDVVQDLWSHSRPPLDLLQAIKHAAKRGGTSAAENTPYPREINIVLYHASIASAWVRYGTRITREDPEKILERLAKVSEYEWLDQGLRELLAAWKQILEQA